MNAFYVHASFMRKTGGLSSICLTSKSIFISFLWILYVSLMFRFLPCK